VRILTGGGAADNLRPFVAGERAPKADEGQWGAAEGV